MLVAVLLLCLEKASLSVLWKYVLCSARYRYLNPFAAVMSLEKRPVKLRNLKPFSLFVFFFTLACERIFIKTHSRRVVGLENTLFAAMSVHLSAQTFYRLGH